MIVYLGFGNSDNKLTQREWVLLQIELKQVIHNAGVQILGEWHSYPDSIFQNACFAFGTLDDPGKTADLQGTIKAIAVEFKQDAIAWNEVTETQFLGPGDHVMTHPGSDHWTGE